MSAGLAYVAAVALAVGAFGAQRNEAARQDDAPSSQARADSQPVDWLRNLAPRAAIAGLAGVECVSILEYAADPSTPHELNATYVFPSRARWQIRVRGREELGRSIEYRCGDTYFVLPQAEGRSIEVSRRSPLADQVSAKCEMLELRRAALLWPDGFEWSESGEARRAASECGRVLLARLGDDGRPRELHFESENGGLGERLVIRSWKQRQNRWWPQDLELWFGPERIWSERVESVTTALSLLDLYFVPPDRRAGSPGGDAAHAVRHIDAPERCDVRVQLPESADWKSVASLWKSESARVFAQLPADWSAAPGVHVELAEDGRPTALLVNLRGAGAAPPGAIVSPATEALLVVERWPAQDLANSLASLRRATPPGASVTRRVASFPAGLEAAVEVQLVARLGLGR